MIHAPLPNLAGAWTDDSTFVVTAVETAIDRPTIGATTVDTSRRLLNAAASAVCCAQQGVLQGDFGVAGPPQLVSFVASDDLNRQVGPSEGDHLTLTFDKMTDMGGHEVEDALTPTQVRGRERAGRATSRRRRRPCPPPPPSSSPRPPRPSPWQVAALFNLSYPLDTFDSAYWSDESTFVISLGEASAAASAAGSSWALGASAASVGGQIRTSGQADAHGDLAPIANQSIQVLSCL